MTFHNCFMTGLAKKSFNEEAYIYLLLHWEENLQDLMLKPATHS